MNGWRDTYVGFCQYNEEEDKYRDSCKLYRDTNHECEKYRDASMNRADTTNVRSIRNIINTCILRSISQELW